MKCDWQKLTWMALASVVAVGVGLSTSLAQQTDEQDEGTVIRVGPDRGPNDPLPDELDPQPEIGRQFKPWLLPGHPGDLARQRRPASPYYIGVAAAKVDEALRAHVDLPDGTGLIVQMVFDGSPADEAGLKQYDILVAADGDDLRELDDLINMVEQHSGEQMTQFTLDVIRNGQPQTVWVTPAERPKSARAAMPADALPGGDVMPPMGPDAQRLLERLQRGGLNLDGVRPHALIMPGGDGAFSMSQSNGDVTVSIERQPGEPASVTVERGDEKWEIDGDDPEALKELPEDVRPMVEGMLGGGRGDMQLPGFDFSREMPADLRERVRQMEEQMRQLREQLQENRDTDGVK